MVRIGRDDEREAARLARMEELCEAGERAALADDSSVTTPIRHRLDLLAAFARWEQPALLALRRGEHLEEPAIPKGIGLAFLRRYGAALDAQLLEVLTQRAEMQQEIFRLQGLSSLTQHQAVQLYRLTHARDQGTYDEPWTSEVVTTTG